MRKRFSVRLVKCSWKMAASVVCMARGPTGSRLEADLRPTRGRRRTIHRVSDLTHRTDLIHKSSFKLIFKEQGSTNGYRFRFVNYGVLWLRQFVSQCTVLFLVLRCCKCKPNSNGNFKLFKCNKKIILTIKTCLRFFIFKYMLLYLVKWKSNKKIWGW